MLKESVQEPFGTELGCELTAILIFIGESDGPTVVADNAFGAEGRAVDVSGEVLEGGLAGAHGLNISHPIQRPDSGINEEEQSRSQLLDSQLEAGTETHGQC